jgi:hypothetical protein
MIRTVVIAADGYTLPYSTCEENSHKLQYIIVYSGIKYGPVTLNDSVCGSGRRRELRRGRAAA